MTCRPFHLALPTADLPATEQFYTEVLSCKIGRRDSTWIDFDLYGHQVVFHTVPFPVIEFGVNPVDDHAVPIPHFGVVLTMADWNTLADRLKAQGTHFIIAPYVRFKDTPGEQATMFFEDNNGYALEFKAFREDQMLFAPFET